MKCRVSITVDEDVIVRVREHIRNKHFDSKSQAFETAMKVMLDGH